jgi:thiamine kinase-like enzyme
MVQPLSSLACFNHIKTIEPIVAGLSSQCYQVNADNKCFFAKQATTREISVSLQAASKNISPTVIFHDQHWLITQYIDSENLALSQQTIDKKILIALKLMVQCHQIIEKPAQLEPKHIAHTLIKQIEFSTLQQTEFLRVANQLTSTLKQPNNNVCCHGDLNLSNILITQTKNAYLVDFECALAAPAEYDLAMFIAVNNIEKNQIETIIECYKKHSTIVVNSSLINRYLQFCYLINGLWYMHAYNKTNLFKFMNLAKQQWENLQILDMDLIR